MSMRLRDRRAPVNYQSSYLGVSSALHPDKPAFLHNDPVFNPELSKHCAFPTLPFNHEGPGPSEVWKRKNTTTSKQSNSSTLDETNETASVRVVVPAAAPPPQPDHARPKKRLLCNTLVKNLTYCDGSSDDYSDSNSENDESEDDGNNNKGTAKQIGNKERFYPTTPRRNSHVLQPIRRPTGSFLLPQNNRGEGGVPGRKDGLKYDSPCKDWVKAAEKREDDLSRGLNSASARNAPPQTSVCRNNNSPQTTAADARESGGPREEQNAATTGSNSSEIRWEIQSTPDGFYRHDYDWRSPPLGQTVSGWADLSMSSSSEDDPFVEVPKNDTPVEPAAAAAAGKPPYKTYLERVRLVDGAAAARNAEDDPDRTIPEPGDQPGEQGRKFKRRTLGLRQPDWFALSQGIRYLIVYELTRLDMSFVRIVRTLRLTAKEVIDLLNLIGTENHKIYQMEAVVKHHTETQSLDCEALWQQIPDPVTVDITGRDIQNAKVFLSFVGLGDVAPKLDQYHGVCTKSAYQIEFKHYQEEGWALPPSFEFNCGPFAGNIWELWRTRQLEQEPGYWERQQAKPQTEPVGEAESAVEAEPVNENARDGPRSSERNSQPRVVLPPVGNLLNVADAAWQPNGWQPNVDWSLFSNVPPASFSGDPVPIGEFYEQLNKAQDEIPANLRHNTPVEPLCSNRVVSQHSRLPSIGALLDPFGDNEHMNQRVEGGRFQNAMDLGNGYYYDAYRGVGGTAEAPITIGDDDQNRGLYNGQQFDLYQRPGDAQEDPIEYQGAPNGDLPPEFFINSLMQRLDEHDGRVPRVVSPHREVQSGSGSAGNSGPIPPSPDFEWPTLEISDDEVSPAVRQGDEGLVTEHPVVREFIPAQRRHGYVNEELARDPVLNYAKPVLLHPDQQLLKSINDILKKYGRQRTHEQVFADRDLTPTPEPESESESEPAAAPAAASSPPRYGDPDDDVWVPALSRRRKAPASRRRSPPPPKSDDDEDDDWNAPRPRATRAPRQRRPAAAVAAEQQPRKRKQATDAEDAPRRKRGRPPKNPDVITRDRLPPEHQLPSQPVKRASGSRRKAEPRLDESGKPIQASKFSGTKRQAEPHDGDDQVPKRRNTGSRRRPSIPIPSSEVGAMLPPPLPSSQVSVDAEDIAEANARRRDRSKSTADMDAIFVNGFGGQLTRREVSALPNVQYMPGGRYGGGKWLEKDTNIIWTMLNPIQQVKKPWIFEGAKARKSRTPTPSLPPVPEGPASIGPPIKEPRRKKQPASLGIRPWLEGEPLNLFQQEPSPFPNISNDAIYHRLWEDNMMTRREFKTYTDFQLYVLRLGEDYFKAGNRNDEALPASQSSTQGSDRRLSNTESVTGDQSAPVSPRHTSAGKGISRTMGSSGSPIHGKGPISAGHHPHTGGKGMDSIAAIYSYLHHGGSEDEEEERDDNQSNGSKNSEAGDDDHNESGSENIQFPRGQGKTYQFAPGGGKNAKYFEEAEKCKAVNVIDTDYSESGDEPSTDEDEEDEW